jgi:hypothetical protein
LRFAARVKDGIAPMTAEVAPVRRKDLRERFLGVMGR